jgi:hypothetical protein
MLVSQETLTKSGRCWFVLSRNLDKNAFNRQLNSYQFDGK